MFFAALLGLFMAVFSTIGTAAPPALDQHFTAYNWKAGGLEAFLAPQHFTDAPAPIGMVSTFNRLELAISAAVIVDYMYKRELGVFTLQRFGYMRADDFMKTTRNITAAPAAFNPRFRVDMAAFGYATLGVLATNFDGRVSGGITGNPSFGKAIEDVT